MVYSIYLKQRIVHLHTKGYKPPTIQRFLREEGLACSRIGIYRFLKHFKEYGLMRKAGSGRPSKISREIKIIVEEKMREDDESTAHQLHNLLGSKGYSISLRTVLRCRTYLGWTFCGSAYCQLIRSQTDSLA